MYCHIFGRGREIIRELHPIRVVDYLLVGDPDKIFRAVSCLRVTDLNGFRCGIIETSGVEGKFEIIRKIQSRRDNPVVVGRSVGRKIRKNFVPFIWIYAEIG